MSGQLLLNPYKCATYFNHGYKAHTHRHSSYGVTGAGKSYYVQLATGADVKIGDGQVSCPCSFPCD
jgi:hypothetical protein